MELPTTLDEFMGKFGGKEASEFEEILKSEYHNYHHRNLNGKYYLLLSYNFYYLPEEEKLKFTVEQAEKIKNDEFIKEKFYYITIAEMKINNENANENLSEFAKKFASKDDYIYYSNDFLIYYFSGYDLTSINFNFEFLEYKEIELVINYKNFFPFINNLLKQKYKDFECEDFLLEIEQNSQNVFDYLTKKIGEASSKNCNNLKAYLYIHMKFEEQTPERFEKLNNSEKDIIVSYAENNESINITQKHVNLITHENQFCGIMYAKSQRILDSRNKQEQEHDTQNVQAKEIEGNKSNKFCEGIKLFFATLFSLGSIASIIVGAVALVSLLTLPFSPWIFVGVGVPVLITALICLGKFANDLINLSSMANEPNAKEENAGSSAISEENNKDENNISEPEVQEEEEDKREIDLNN